MQGQARGLGSCPWQACRLVRSRRRVGVASCGWSLVPGPGSLDGTQARLWAPREAHPASPAFPPRRWRACPLGLGVPVTWPVLALRTLPVGGGGRAQGVVGVFTVPAVDESLGLTRESSAPGMAEAAWGPGCPFRPCSCDQQAPGSVRAGPPPPLAHGGSPPHGLGHRQTCVRLPEHSRLRPAARPRGAGEKAGLAVAVCPAAPWASGADPHGASAGRALTWRPCRSTWTP